MSQTRNTALFATALAVTTAAVVYDHSAFGVPEPVPTASPAPAAGVSPCSAGAPAVSPCSAGAPVSPCAAGAPSAKAPPPPPPAPMPEEEERVLAPPPPPPAPMPTAESKRTAPPPPPAKLPDGATEAPDLAPDRDT